MWIQRVSREAPRELRRLPDCSRHHDITIRPNEKIIHTGTNSYAEELDLDPKNEDLKLPILIFETLRRGRGYPITNLNIFRLQTE